MDKQESNDRTIFSIAKPSATSTVDRNRRKKEELYHSDDSLGILSLNSANLSDISIGRCRDSLDGFGTVNKVNELPSKYFRKVQATPDSYRLCHSPESTISDTDLMSTPTNTSTPRNSIDVNNFGESMMQLSSKICNGAMSFDAIPNEIQKALEKSQATLPKLDCSNFVPGENAENLLMADELSWRNRNEMPVQNDCMSLQSVPNNVSLGEFFLKKSDTISDIGGSSPEKSDAPVPLISFTEGPSLSNCVPAENSLSVTAIQKLIAQENSTSKILDYLTNKVCSVPSNSRNSNSVATLSIPTNKKISSYTSDTSENNAMNSIAVSENVPKYSEIRSASPVSRCSSRASSSLTDLPSGKLPIETSEVELIWGCVKVDRCVTRDFLIRNTSTKRLKIQLQVSGRQFKLSSDNRSDGETYTSVKIVMHPRETKNIRVSFMPTETGAAVDFLNFQTLDPNHQQTVKQCIRLYGYGGLEKIEIEDLTRYTNNKFWLALGKLNSDRAISRSFCIKNSGQLAAFVHIAFKSKECFEVEIRPQFFSLGPQECKDVTVTYRPSLKDLRCFQSSTIVTDIGSFTITSGAEATRGRIRRLCRKNEEIGHKVDSLAEILKQRIDDEKMPSDLVKFREQARSLEEMMKLVNHDEVVVTIERDLDQTMIPQYMEETGMFQSLLLNTDDTIVESKISMEPTTIFLTPPHKIYDILFLESGMNKSAIFHVNSDPEGVDVQPRSGTIGPGQRLILKISITKLSQKHKQFKVKAFIENETVESLVKIITLD